MKLFAVTRLWSKVRALDKAAMPPLTQGLSSHMYSVSMENTFLFMCVFVCVHNIEPTWH